MRKVLLLRARFDFFFKFKIIFLICNIHFFSFDGFSGDGCYVDPLRSNSKDTVCRCNHLTHFAVLVDFRGDAEVFFFFLRYFTSYFLKVLYFMLHEKLYCPFSLLPQLSKKDVTILEIITYVGLSLSIVGILLTITLYSFLT